MKKIFCLITFSMLFLVSCSSDDSPSESETSNLLLKQINEGDIVFGGTVTDYTYNGNKLLEIRSTNDSGVFSHIYTYTGNLITKIEKFEIDYVGTPGEQTLLLSTDEFQYNGNDQLVQFKTTTPDSDEERVTTYVYNSGNTVTFEQYSNSPGNAPQSLKTGTITVQDGEISRLQVVKEFDSYTDNYTYDTKNSILKNVVGYDKLIFTHIIGKQGSFTSVETIVGGISRNFLNGEFEYTYNSDNYPITATQSWFGSVLHSYEFVYY